MEMFKVLAQCIAYKRQFSVTAEQQYTYLLEN